MLLMTRREGGVVYGGFNLTEDIHETFDHAIRVERIIDRLKHRSVDLTLCYENGVTSNIRLTPENNEHRVNDSLRILLVGMYLLPVRGLGLCPTVRLGFDAPRSYRLVRDDAIRRTD